MRCATASTDMGPAAVAPYRSGRWLFSHNGVINGWPGSVAGLAETLPAGALLELETRTDSALLWALVLHRLRLGLAPADALADTRTLPCGRRLAGRRRPSDCSVHADATRWLVMGRTS